MIIRRYHAILFGAALLLSGAVSYSSYEPLRYQLSGPMGGELPRRPWIALTFDDGPHPGRTEELMSVLKEEGVPATFFIVGKMAVRYPDIVREMARQGHEVSNHTFSHPNLPRTKSPAVVNELTQTRAVIQQLTGQETYLYRPPGGDYSRRTVKAAAEAGYHMVLWDILTKDVNGATVEAMKKRILDHASDGSIVLMHSGVPNTVAMLPDVIADLRVKGYRFVTVSQILGLENSRNHRLPPLPEVTSFPLVSR
jgi:peptidoglycan/xylan/chitin deacetylase (PgdA/CDA1 family)